MIQQVAFGKAIHKVGNEYIMSRRCANRTDQKYGFQRDFSMNVPSEIPPLIDQALLTVRTDPEHEFGQSQRRAIYTALHSTPKGVIACKWWAILAANRVVPIYEKILAGHTWPHDDIDNGEEELFLSWVEEEIKSGFVAAKEWLCPIEKQTSRMVQIAEGVMKGEITLDYAREALSNVFYNNWSIVDILPKRAVLALGAAYESLCEVVGVMPLTRRVTSGFQSPDGMMTYIKSDLLKNEQILFTGSNAADAAVKAAYAYASTSDTPEMKYDYAQLESFWKWWLTDALNDAWLKADVNDI
jgi:hypothetical protein